ncbi:hypothetical protein A3G67_02565 [Candidatus Roizmanbacteria bacterium RIFCSPLOWO2_12_FULL_40_12]|uniref:Divalent-cation tolerance protein CutA n=1 Tax=Candidatus Roizmanbacteria bacterium RIFCSPLOWO2_01_FULL_40_42 TaxID=1802066 RepID=A0A1F7J624_9BACT|nr:MAG: hypothetical protein A2779_03855 [Candidatus Roizmanbacteria bacterium RIFCSPHIGHO2_01_FULL_40_98]OGK27865.1 MAG: hypothetical protein A3C31_03820 [Candidatus Roizmanbacteria bacterium RIFCSPHIGHO2_02_FULL_40_53]OGK29416.1 MAG: hypothetical protein A2W49_04185 [Candidatus Roizmanbacteria bacterium RIFCSPHIGHO2_12_41_18]OGK36619.1 MAG: hypothetical protein A3E69_00090 [Candidatus Roizmanbacteria bacterium RIFCSPHIGHO2_12_FULL_40_130]OGK51057.1 MAG: hypothetical protein A3B50_02740 [Candi
MKPVVLLLTCGGKEEADKIVKALLEKKLIVCAKSFSVSSTFYWKNSIDSGEEIFIVMDSSENLFEKVEEEIRKLHSYDTFNLVSIPVTKTSRGVVEWMKEGLLK